MKFRRLSFGLTDLIGVVTAVVLCVAIAGPGLLRTRELSRRLTCRANLGNLGMVAKIHANDHDGSWMVPPFKTRAINTSGIEYTLSNNGAGGPGQTGYKRLEPTTSDDVLPNSGSTQVAVTRAFWMLVRSGDFTVEQFICPSSGDVPDPTEQVDLYYDFTSYSNISYGYQVPFGPRDTRPAEGPNNRRVFAADKGPFYLRSPEPTWRGPTGAYVQLSHPAEFWRAYNSPNHGEVGNGEGQNCLFGDGHASFAFTPTVGYDGDNIYTLMEGQWGPLPYNRIHGETVHEATPPPYPGQNTLGYGAGRHSTTDSLVYP